MNKKKATSKTAAANKKNITSSTRPKKSDKPTVAKVKSVKKKTSKSKVSKKTIAMAGASKIESKKPQSEPDPMIELENLRPNLKSGYMPSDKEEYMNEMQLAYFKIKLLDWKSELVHQSQETLYNLKTESRDVSDEAERASRESDNILELRTRDRYRKLLSKIDAALRRISDGSYGYCEETGEEIGLRRLEARPTATLTVDAQERREMLQKQFRDDR